MMEESRIFEERSFEIRERQKSLKVSLSCDQRAAGFWQRNARALAQLTLSLSPLHFLSRSFLLHTYIHIYVACVRVFVARFFVSLSWNCSRRKRNSPTMVESLLSPPLFSSGSFKRGVRFLFVFPRFVHVKSAWKAEQKRGAKSV